ncbi:hypothetical protein FJ951_17535 [Mesorhizobium sp. B2-2-3]|uniref:hypothetical protein n=1 Tax=Mesorhizobium sp. B2-2-3 TaxID=2589963 RepID=UPI0011294130|nr:hypothetical protein [Mesorhizobium sp. B2-2-3]TPM45632.1 hypothetical protein FJ951_17535 [Mesorhizobium sp. B2-2-3]
MNSHFTTFQSWTNGRLVKVIGTNHGSSNLPFQGWRTFKEAFAPELIEMAVSETSAARGEPVRHLVDPFGGSGTSALAAQFLGVMPTTIEVNPYLSDLIETKIARYDLDAVSHAFGQICSDVAEAKPVQTPLPGMPDTFVEPGRAGRYIFSREVAQRLHAYVAAISNLENSEAQRLFKVLLAGILLQVSNVVVSGKGRRYRRGGVNKSASAASVDGLFSEKVVSALFDLKRFENRMQRDYRVLRGDARVRLGECAEAQLAVFSPPYPNSFDYTDVYNLELWVLGYLTTPEANRSLRESTIRSHVQIKRDMTSSVSNTTLADIVARLTSNRKQLWNRDIPEMVSAYFDDMVAIMTALHNLLATSGRIYMVVGDSRYAGIDIPVAQILCELGPTIGLDVLYSNPFRSMRASPQQGGRPELPETLIALKKSS